MTSIGLIGLGLLGSAIADRLLAAQYGVVGFDVSEERRRVMLAAGGMCAESAMDVARICPIIVLNLPDSGVVSRVLTEIRPQLNNHLVIDTTTGAPDDSRLFADQLRRCGSDYLDATVVGSSEQVRQSDAVVLVGGMSTAFDRALPVLRAFSKQQFFTGISGSGATAKLIVNLVLGLNRAVLAEGLHLAKQCGLDQNAMLTILQSGAAWSRVMDTKGRKMIDRDFSPQARLDQHAKDVGLILELGRTTGASLPLSDVHRTLLARASELGFGDRDNSAIIQAFES